LHLFKNGQAVSRPAFDLLANGAGPNGHQADASAVTDLPDEARICNCNAVSKGRILEVIRDGKCSVAAIGECTRAGTGCGSCQPLLAQFLDAYGAAPASPLPLSPGGRGVRGEGGGKNKVELMKEQKDGLESLPDLLRYAATGNWEEMTEDDKQRFKWH